MNYGKRLNSFRTQAGLSQKELGVRLGYPASTAEVRVAQYESGGRHPRKETVDSMANALGISPHALTVPAIESDTELMHLLFALEDEYRLKPSLVFGTFCLLWRSGAGKRAGWSAARSPRRNTISGDITSHELTRYVSVSCRIDNTIPI